MEIPHSATLVKALTDSITRAERTLTALARSKGLLSPDQKIHLQIQVTEDPASKETSCSNGSHILSAEIKILGLSKAVCDRLNFQGIDTVEQLIKKNPEEIAKHRCCGKKFLLKIVEALQRQGLDFENPIPDYLVWRPGPSIYEQTLDRVNIQTLSEEDWRHIEEVSWKKYQKNIIGAIRIIGNRPLSGRRMFRYTEQKIHVGTIVRCINDQFTRANLPYRLKATTNLDPEDEMKMAWGFQIGVLSKE